MPMIRGGQRPLPTALKKLHGQKPRKTEVIAVGDLSDDPLRCPSYFSKAQRDCWVFYIEYAPPTLLKILDTGALERYVVLETMYRNTVQAYNKALDVSGAKGANDLDAAALAELSSRQAINLNRLAIELGFTPVSRSRVGIVRQNPKLPKNTTEYTRPKDEPQQTLEAFLANAPTTRTTPN